MDFGDEKATSVIVRNTYLAYRTIKLYNLITFLYDCKIIIFDITEAIFKNRVLEKKKNSSYAPRKSSKKNTFSNFGNFFFTNEEEVLA